jgi:hypothetical protein
MTTYHIEEAKSNRAAVRPTPVVRGLSYSQTPSLILWR